MGAGPCGLRYAIETQLLGGKATVMEKRASFTRNNVLHLWPFVIEDLKMLGTKNFYPKFCTGSMNHISIKKILFWNRYIRFFIWLHSVQVSNVFKLSYSKCLLSWVHRSMLGLALSVSKSQTMIMILLDGGSTVMFLTIPSICSTLTFSSVPKARESQYQVGWS